MKKIIAAVAGVGALGLAAYAWLSSAEESPAPQTAAAEPAEAGPVALAEGRNYRVVTPAQPTQSGEKVEVLEIFWYGCPHCNDFEPHLDKWLDNKPAAVAFRRLPGVFRQSWVPGAQAFYTAEALGVLDEAHPALFRAMHEERRELKSAADWQEIFEDLGVSETDFTKTWESVEVATKVREAIAQVQNYGIDGVPAIVVDGRYQTTAGMEGVGDFPTMLKVVDALVDKVREDAKQQP